MAIEFVSNKWKIKKNHKDRQTIEKKTFYDYLIQIGSKIFK
jgi:hypothetical protein